MDNAPALARMSDGELVAEVARLAQREHAATADLIASLVELDKRRLYLAEGFPSLFAYCTQRLHLSEHAAYHRIEAARASQRFALVLERLREGALTLTAVGLLRPHLTDDNHREVLDAARHQGKRVVEELVARLHARPDVRASVRKLPEPRSALALERTPVTTVPTPPSLPAASTPPRAPATTARVVANQECALAALLGDVVEAPAPLAAAPRRPPIVRALAPARYQVQMTVSAETHAKLRRAQDLLRHAIPNGDPAEIFDRALSVLLESLERTKFAATKGRLRVARPHAEVTPLGAQSGGRRGAAKPSRRKVVEENLSKNGEKPGPPIAGSSRSRRIPSAVRRAVWQRDGGQCAFVGTSGRCPERGFLEFHHLVPFAEGGDATVGNIALACRQHNVWEADRWFGPRCRQGARPHSPGVPPPADLLGAEGSIGTPSNRSGPS